ncbi:DUF2163 domain-containing protein [Limoniibacter endophyticus]|uniref:Bacteriophage phiJL001 Gp84 C-terminal domain-containing protein n=1 Tax=Limoniibacter endophyticus TaxID=1565040 RepID=A0A8J3GGK6_9HYPH|nr:DUF2163 domain-containing protein [Limoniibacter endophyticus]GHC69292.1 hypothetical protein GCM10010136_14970 [Limoniibacter endophyticus]
MSEDALRTHLAGAVTSACHCWIIARNDGVREGYTDHDRALNLEDVDCLPEAGFSASEARERLGLGVDTTDIEGALSSSRIDETAIDAGAYDGARVEMWLVNWRKPQERMLLRAAQIGKITRADGRFVAELVSAKHVLDKPMGRFIRRQCDANLGDERCRVDLNHPAYHARGAVTAMTGQTSIRVSGLDGFTEGWFDHGWLSFENGQRLFVVAHVRGTEGVIITFRADARLTAETGEAFRIAAGCDKRFSSCKTKFANALNFQGFPHLPGNDAAYGYVSGTGHAVFDGSPLVP